MSDQPDEPPAEDPQAPAFRPTDIYDEAAIKRARELLNNMPESVGPYRILERIGGGGMGEVYRAEQRSPIRRQVALKFIKLGMDTKLVIARFEAERQALALMDHPHIAKVFDAGTDEIGRPYFVMEYVKGKPITEYADQNHLTIRERLELFEQVCQAIQHAHHKGIIHRDLKPGNVLVSTQDDKPFAKVIDFGIAKAIAQRLTDGTLFTEHDQFVGTPQYMSPEQADGCVDIDTRTDVYSLGVLLYELLTGSTPFSTKDLRAAAFAQIKKLIIEVDPPKPSTRLSLTQPTLSTLAASRRTEPKRLGSLVQGELDWIVMKSIEKDRQRRYETPTSLAHDIQAHLHGEPVQAAPPSTAYLIQKFVKKHRGPVIAVSLIGAVLILGIIGTTWGYYRAERIAVRERQAKERESTAKQDANDQRDVAIQARQQAVAAQDQAEGALARGFVRPLVGADVLAPNEIESLWELATLESDTIGLRMLDEATLNPQMTEQLLNSAEPALVAAIGLNPELRQRALALLRSRLNEPSLTLDHRAGIAWITLMLTDKPGPDSAVLEALIKESFAANTHSQTPVQSYSITYPNRAVTILGPNLAAELLLAGITNPKLDDWYQNFAFTFSSLSKQLEPNTALRIAEALLVAIDDQKQNSRNVPSLILVLTALASRLEPDVAARLCELASNRCLEYFLNTDVGPVDFDGFSEFTMYLNPSTTERFYESLSDRLLVILADPNRNHGTYWLSEVLSRLSMRLEPDAVERFLDKLFTVLVQPRLSNEDAINRARILSSLLLRLNPGAAERFAILLVSILSDAKQTNVQIVRLASAISTISARLEPLAATRICGAACDRLLTRIADPIRTVNEIVSLVEVIPGLSDLLEPIDAARVCESSLDALFTASGDPHLFPPATFFMIDVALKRLEPVAAERFANTFLAALTDPKRTNDEITNFIQAILALSERLEPHTAVQVSESASDLLLVALADPKRNGADQDYSLDQLLLISGQMQSSATKIRTLRAIRTVAMKQLSQEVLSFITDSTKYFDAEMLAKIARHLDASVCQSVLNELFKFQMAFPDDSGVFGTSQPSDYISESLAFQQRQEPHQAVMAAPSDDKKAATVPDYLPFATLKLTTPEIVEFLKSPLVQGVYRRAFLDLLECRYGRRFGNQWAFVEYAQAENLGLDFTTRVKRPDPQAILQNIRKLLDDEAK